MITIDEVKAKLEGEVHDSTAQVLRWLDSQHLPPHLQEIAKPIEDLAYQLVQKLPGGPELTEGVRKLLQAKDAFVRQAVEAEANKVTVPEALSS